MHPDFEEKLVGKVKKYAPVLYNRFKFIYWREVLHLASLTNLIVHFLLWTYLLRDNVFTQSIPVLRRSAMVSQHVVCLWRNTIKMCNKRVYLVP